MYIAKSFGGDTFVARDIQFLCTFSELAMNENEGPLTTK